METWTSLFWVENFLFLLSFINLHLFTAEIAEGLSGISRSQQYSRHFMYSPMLRFDCVVCFRWTKMLSVIFAYILSILPFFRSSTPFLFFCDLPLLSPFLMTFSSFFLFFSLLHHFFSIDDYEQKNQNISIAKRTFCWFITGGPDIMALFVFSKDLVYFTFHWKGFLIKM